MNNAKNTPVVKLSAKSAAKMNTAKSAAKTKKAATKKAATKKPTAKKTATKKAAVVTEAPTVHPMTDSAERFEFSIINYNKRNDAPMLDVKFGSDDLQFFIDNAITPANRTGGYQFIMIDNTETKPRKRYTKRYAAKFHAETFFNAYNEKHGIIIETAEVEVETAK